MTPTPWLTVLASVLVVYVGLLFFLRRTLRPFYGRIFLCLTPLVLAGLIVGAAWERYQRGEGGFRLGVDLVGGTVLVYEIDESKFPDGRPPANYRPEDLAASLKRRIDPADLYNVTIRPMSTTRVEIILPTGGKHQAEADEARWDRLVQEVQEKWPPPAGKEYRVARGDVADLVDQVVRAHKGDGPGGSAASGVNPDDVTQFINTHYHASRNLSSEEVQQVKEKISEVGMLEFRILANTTDDKEAIDAARNLLTQMFNDPRGRATLDELARHDQPPPAPQAPAGAVGFTTPKGTFKYAWVELGRAERAELGLANADKGQPFWNEVAAAREKGQPVDLRRLGDSLLYSRRCVATNLSNRDRDKQYEYFLLTRGPEVSPDDPEGKRHEITGDHLLSADETSDASGQIAVGFTFKPRGGSLFYDVTSKNTPTQDFKRHLAIVLDRQIISAPAVNSAISTNGIIEGRFTKEQVDRLVGNLRAGALPATLKPQPVSENTIGATLGEDTIRKGTIAVGLAFVVILVFMIAYYRFAGLVASIALLANLLLTVAFMVAVNATFTLPGLAGLVLMLGMAVDANVLIYERLREERDRGASLALSIRNGYDRAFPTIIDTHLSSIFTAIVLYAVGNDQLKGFGVSLTVGLIISLFTSLYMTRLMFDIWLNRGWLHKLSMFRLFSRPNINFMGIRYYWFTATIILTVIGISVFIWRLPQDLNIDFVGGTLFGGQLNKQMDIEALRANLTEEQQRKVLAVADVRPVGDNAFVIKYADGSERTIQLANPASRDELLRRASELPDLSVEMIFPPVQTVTGPKSRFNIRTSERDAQLVQASISRLLGEDLNRQNLTYVADKDGKGAELRFHDAREKDRPVYASPSVVQSILQAEFRQQGIERSLSVRGEPGSQGRGDTSDRYSAMRLTLSDPVDPTKLTRALADTKHEFDQRADYERLENFDRVLAAETQTRAMVAILASWGAILLYLWFRFGNWTFGLAAVLCLIHDLFFTMGIIAFCHYVHQYAPGLAAFLKIEDFKIDLPAVAALLTLVGYSVNDTIVVFDRIREVRGKNPELTPQMINDSVNQTLSRTLLTSFATWLVVIVLYIFGGEGVHLFAFCMVVGVIVGTYSSIYIASPLLLIFGEGARPAAAPRRRPEPVGTSV